MFSPYSLDITGFSDFCHRPQEVNKEKPASASIVGTRVMLMLQNRQFGLPKCSHKKWKFAD
jgi:hypothetical protein